MVDANLLLYAYSTRSELHAQARAWLENVLSQADPVRFAWVTLLAYVRISTDPRATLEPLTPRKALGHVAEWLEQPCAAVLEPGERHLEILQRVTASGQARGPLVMDAHLAALAIEHGALLCSTDQDFTRFKGLRWKNPLEH